MKVLKSVELLKKTYDRLLGEVAKGYDITLNELKILMFLEKNDENNIAKNIVEGIGTTKSHVSMSVCDLEKKGYIEKAKDENDKKKSHLQITKKAEQVIEDGKRVQNNVKQIMFDGIDKEELEVLNRISKRIQENLETYNNYGGKYVTD